MRRVRSAVARMAHRMSYDRDHAVEHTVLVSLRMLCGIDLVIKIAAAPGVMSSLYAVKNSNEQCFQHYSSLYCKQDGRRL